MKRIRRRSSAFLVTVAATALVAGLTVSPAAAGQHASGTGLACGWEAGASEFSSLARLGTSGTDRAGKPNKAREKSTAHIVSDTELPPGKARKAAIPATIPVYFHVITKGAEGHLTDGQIEEQMNVLNLAFAGFYGGADFGMQFELAGVTRTENADWYDLATFAAELEMKAALKRGDAKALNVYTGSADGYLGWAYYPSIVVQRQYQVLDGVVLDYNSLPGGAYGPAYSLGHTLTHEAGHWLGLAHTFEQGCQGHGDYVADTPAMSIPSGGCPIGKDTCPQPGLDPIHNYMDYSFDSCFTEFTPGQRDRAHKQWSHWRVQVGYN
jgi:hypothetical protein